LKGKKPQTCDVWKEKIPRITNEKSGKLKADFLEVEKTAKRRYLRNTCLHPNMSDFIAPTLINWLIENLEFDSTKKSSGITEKI
jgi:hypothetical protein